MSKNRFGCLLLSLCVAAGISAAEAASVPYTFQPGGLASAEEVNANFAALVEAVTALEDKVSPQTAESLAGTYDYFEIKVDVDNLSGSSKSIAGAAVTGTVVLNADGTGQADLSGSYRQVTFNAVANPDETVQMAFFDVPESTNAPINWSFANGKVTIAEAGTFAVVGQLLIEGFKNSEGQNGLVILARR